MFNEYEQILWQRPMTTASLKELKEELKLMILGRYIGRGFKLPSIYYTDECCDDREILQSVFDELKEEGFPIQLDTHHSHLQDEQLFPELKFPTDIEPAYISTNDHASAACLTIREEMERLGSLVLGFDCEWQVIFNSEVKHPATIQLSTYSGRCFLFHVIRGNSKPSFLPKALEQLLEDDKIIKVGVGIKGDCTRLEKAYGVEVANIVDVAQFAISRKMEIIGHGLRDLVRKFLQHDLPKDPKIRNSNWQAKNLSHEQIIYACLDAYASVQVYMFIENNCDPIWRNVPSEQELTPNRHVLLYTKESTECAGEGVVIAYEQETYGRYHLHTKYHNRKVVLITKVLIPLARMPYCFEGQPKTMMDSKDTEVLWDVDRMRLLLSSQASTCDQVLPTTHESTTTDPNIDLLQTYTSPSDYQNFFSSFDINDDLDAQLSRPPLDEIIVEIGTDTSTASSDEERSEISSNDNNANNLPPLFAVRLDIFHAMQRISRTLKLKHGAAHAFLARLRDAFFLVCKEDINAICTFLEKQGLSEDEINKKKNEDWVFFLQHCRRAVPGSKILLYRFDKVCNLFGNLEDAKTKEPLFREETKKKIKNLRVHIKKGCLSDVPGIPLYHVACKDSQSGLPVYRCVRGTNSIEGYHRHLRRLLAMYCGSPRLVHSILLEFNYRWNVRMAIKNRGLPDEIGGFYQQYLLDQIREMSINWSPTHLFPEWISVRDFEDTMERSGLQRSKLTGDDSIIDDVNIKICWGLITEDDETSLELGSSNDNNNTERTPLSSLTPSAEYFAKLQGFKIPITAVVTAKEKQKFADEWSRYIISGSDKVVRNQRINFTEWAIDWNRDVERMEKGDAPLTTINRKHASHLESYFRRYFAKSNANTTLHPIRHKDARLRKELRETDLDVGHGVIGEISAPAQQPQRSSLHASANLKGSRHILPSTTLPSSQPALQPRPAQSPLQPIGMVTTDSPDSLLSTSLAGPVRPASRSTIVHSTPHHGLPQVCQTCGHLRRTGYYKEFHKRGGCNVSDDERRTPCFCTMHNNRRKHSKRHYHICDCQRCMQ
jgi:hypothetical protein